MIAELKDLVLKGDTPEVIEKLKQILHANSAFDIAYQLQDHKKMDIAAGKIEELTQEIFKLRETILTPYPATVPSELSPMEQEELFENKEELIGDWDECIRQAGL